MSIRLMLRLSSISAVALAAGVFTTTGARAQEAAQGNNQATASEADSTEIVVTARKREERLSDIPQSISVLTADALENLGAVQFRDFADTVPGLSFQSGGAGFTQVSLRGVTTGLDVSSTVGVYVDEVPYGSSTGFARGGNLALDVGLFDIERVEVLSGPQGTLYGASTMGGLLKYVTRSPDLNRFGGQAVAGLSSTNEGGLNYNLAGVVNVPLASDRAAIRATGFYTHDAGYIDNPVLGREDVDRADIYGGRLDLSFRPTDSLSIRLTGYAQDIDRDGTPIADYTLAGVPVIGALVQTHRAPEPFEQTFRLASGTIDYDFGPVSLTSITSYQAIRTTFAFDRSPGFVGLCGRVGVTCSAVAVLDETATNKFTQEVRLASNGSGAFEWLVGGFYTSEDSEASQSLLLTDLSGQLSSANLFAFTAPSRYREYAGFGNVTWNLTDRFSLSGGLRFAHNRQVYEQRGSGNLGVSTPRTPASESVWTYLANAQYRFNDRVMAYARFSTGYRPGGPNFVILNPNTGQPIGPAAFEADRLESYEIGLRAETPDRRFALDVAAYHLDWSNILIGVVVAGFGARDNANGGADIDGVELKLTARPDDRLRFTGAFAYQDARLAAAEPRIGGAAGAPLPGVPKFTATVTGDYDIPVGLPGASIGFTLRFVDDRLGNFAPVPRYRLPSYETVDLRAEVDLGTFRLQTFVRNLFDVRGQIITPFSSPATGPILISTLQPRTIGLRVTKDF